MGMGWISLVLAAGFGLHPTGGLHGDEALVGSGEHWLAVDSTPTGLRLSTTRIRVDRVMDEIVDAPGEATGANVVAVDVPGATMLLRGPALHAGPVEAADVVVGEGPGRDGGAAFRFRGTEYRLQPGCPEALPGPGSGQTCRMMLTGGAVSQALYEVQRWRGEDGSITYGEAAYRSVIHAADFDRDGRPDLILDTADHYNVSQPTLYLSTPAPSGEALKEVARHRSTGC